MERDKRGRDEKERQRQRNRETLWIFPKSIVPLELTVCKYRSSAQQREHQKISISN